MADCDDALSAYNDLVTAATKIDADVAKDRQGHQTWILVFRSLLVIWLASGGLALLCEFLQFNIVVCDTLFVVALIDSVVMLLVFVGVSVVSLRLRKNKEKCHDIGKRLSDAFNEIPDDCPEEKRPARVPQLKCMSDSDEYVIDWFKPLDLKGDYAATTLDGYFKKIDERLKDDMAFLRRPIRSWRARSGWLRFIAFVLLALGVIAPLPIFRIGVKGPSGLEIGYAAVLVGGLLLLFDQVFAVSSSWMRLTLAEMQIKQIRYRLELDWARRRPLLTPESQSTEGPALIDMLKAACDTAHDVMESQKEAWNNELRRGIEALRSRLNDDRLSIEKLRGELIEASKKPAARSSSRTTNRRGQTDSGKKKENSSATDTHESSK